MVTEDAAYTWYARLHGSLDLEEAFFTPGGSPRVFDEPIIRLACRICAIANKEDGMVDYGATLI